MECPLKGALHGEGLTSEMVSRCVRWRESDYSPGARNLTRLTFGCVAVWVSCFALAVVSGARDVPRDFLNWHIRRAAPSHIPEGRDKLAPDKKRLLKESPEK